MDFHRSLKVGRQAGRQAIWTTPFQVYRFGGWGNSALIFPIVPAQALPNTIRGRTDVAAGCSLTHARPQGRLVAPNPRLFLFSIRVGKKRGTCHDSRGLGKAIARHRHKSSSSPTLIGMVIMEMRPIALYGPGSGEHCFDVVCRG